MKEKELMRLACRTFSCYKTHHLSQNLCCRYVRRANNIELLMLVLDFAVNSRLKILNGIFMESMECLNEDE